MRFGILGPLQVVRDDGTCLVFAPRLSRVLAMLLVRCGQVVPADDLIEAVWDDDPPTTARRQVHNCVSMLRREIVIAADRQGYRLVVQSGQLDAQVFHDHTVRAQTLAAAHHTAAAVNELRAALGLWRGGALTGLAGRTFQAVAARLDEQRIATIERCCGLELDLGRHRDLTGELTELVASHPLREGLVGLLMRALHGSGRQAEALAAYQQLRTRLVEELGIDPGDALREVHARMLRDEMAPHPAAVVPRQLPSTVGHFVGRAAELKALNRLADEATGSASSVTVCAIIGSGGIGKTSLAVHWAHRNIDRFPDGQLYVDLRGFGPGEAPLPPQQVLRSFLRALNVGPDRIPVGELGLAETYRSTMFGRRMLILLDNASDSEQVRPLLPGAAPCLTVVTSRNQLSGLAISDGAHLLPLGLLDNEEAGELLAQRLGRKRVSAQPTAVSQIIGSCSGLPLALAAVAAHAAARPEAMLSVFADQLAETSHRLDALDTGEARTGARTVFSWSYTQLSKSAARLFRLLGLHPGARATLPAIRALVGVSPNRSLQELVRRNLIVEDPPDVFSSHDLLRAYAHELAEETDAEPVRQAALDRVIDFYLQTAQSADRTLYPRRHTITPLPCPPGIEPLTFADKPEALAWFEKQRSTLVEATAAAQRAGRHRHGWQLAWMTINFLERRGYLHDWITILGIARDCAARVDETSLATAHRYLARGLSQVGRLTEAAAELEQSLSIFRRLGDRINEGHSYGELAILMDRQGRRLEARSICEQALKIYQDVGFEAGQAHMLNNIAWQLGHLDRADEAVTFAQQAMALFVRVDGRYGQAMTWHTLGNLRHILGQHSAAVEAFERSLQLNAGGDRYAQGMTLHHLGDAQQAMETPEAATISWRQALAIFEELRHADANDVRRKLRA